MTIRWRLVLPILLLSALIAVAFSAYAYSRPTTYCVIVNEKAQTTIKASGKRCTALSPEEKAVVLTPDGAYGDRFQRAAPSRHSRSYTITYRQ